MKWYLCGVESSMDRFIVTASIPINMSNPSNIKIFLASSITELKNERMQLADYINDTVAPILKNVGINVHLFKCEDELSGNFGEPSQKVFDKELEASDVSVFLFKAKAGKKTIGEFDLARKLQREKKHGIYVFCFDVPANEKSQELKGFQQRLEKEEFYWKTCEDINSLKSQFLPGLLKQLFGNWESDEEKDIDTRLKQYKDNEEKQTQRRERLHQDIENLLQQIEATMADEGKNIAVRIAKAIELYQKADDIAAATAYDKEKYAKLLFGYAQFLYKYGLYKDSETIWLRQIPLVEELYGKISKEASASYNDIGIVYKEIGDYKKALNYLSKALNTKEIVFGTGHADTAVTYNDIGLVYKYDGNYRKALKYYRRALTIRKRIPTNYIDISESLNNIGALYIGQKKYDKALKYLRKAFAIRKKVFDAKDSRISVSYNNIGMVYFKKHNYEKALKYYHATLKIREEILGKEHPLTATSYNNIGEVYREQGDYDNALKYLLRALEIRKKIPSQKYLHPYIAQSYNNIGMVYYAQGNYRKALDNLNEAYCIYEITLDPEHPDAIQTHRNIELVQKAM